MGFNRSPAPEAEEVALRLIRKHHEHLLKNEVILRYRFRDDLPASGGQEVWYGVQKVGGWASYDVALAEGFDTDEDEESPTPSGYYRLWFSKPIWDGLKEEQREALVDAALCECGSGVAEKSGRVVLTKLSPDLRLFTGNLGRYGAWHEGVAEAVRAIAKNAQGELPLEEVVQEAEMHVFTQEEREADPLYQQAKVAAEEVKAEREAQEGPESTHFLTLPCGHEMAYDEFNQGLPCPHCAVQDGISAVASANGNGKHAGQDPSAEGFTEHKKAKRKGRLTVEQVAAIPEA